MVEGQNLRFGNRKRCLCAHGKKEPKKNKSDKKSSLRYEKTHSAPLQKSTLLQRYQDDSIFQNALKELKEKAQTEPYEPSEWQATLRYVEQDLDTHVEEAQERHLRKQKEEEETESVKNSDKRFKLVQTS